MASATTVWFSEVWSYEVSSSGLCSSGLRSTVVLSDEVRAWAPSVGETVVLAAWFPLLFNTKTPLQDVSLVTEPVQGAQLTSRPSP